MAAKNNQCMFCILQPNKSPRLFVGVTFIMWKVQHGAMQDILQSGSLVQLQEVA
jgi:hypothetical protein